MTAVSSKAGSEPEKNNSKKEKFSPPTKVVIRRLPPSMTKDEFEDQVSPIPDHDYLRWLEHTKCLLLLYFYFSLSQGL